MNIDFLATVAQAAPTESSVMQALALGSVIVFIAGGLTTGFTAKKIENIHNPSYGKGFLAEFFVGLFSLVGLMMFGIFLKAPPLVALAIAYSIIPILVYKMVFAAMWSEAAIIWVVVTIVHGGVGYALVLTGFISLAGFTSA